LYPELGITEVITTSSRVENGTYFLSANGFHYSSPTIKVKVVQDNPSPMTDNKAQLAQNSEPRTSTNTKSTAAQKNSTISCVKGKTTKKVTAVKPKCPAGFKKK
jgi:hypothetical protein